MARKYLVELYESDGFFAVFVKTMLLQNSELPDFATGEIIEADLPIDVISYGVSKFDVPKNVDGASVAGDYHSQYPKKLYLAICRSVEEIVIFLRKHFTQSGMNEGVTQLMCDSAKKRISDKLATILPSEN